MVIRRSIHNCGNTLHAFKLIAFLAIVCSIGGNCFSQSVDITYYAFDIDIPDSGTILQARVQFHAINPTYKTKIPFLLSRQLKVTSVSSHEKELPYQHSDDTLWINVGSLNAEQILYLNLQTVYNGPANNPSGRGGVQYKTNQFGEYVTFSFTEPFSAFYWFPTQQDLTDKIDSVLFRGTCSSEYRIGSNGQLIAVDSIDKKHVRYSWKTNYPTAYYLVSFSKAKYHEYNFQVSTISEGSDSVPIINYIYTDSTHRDEWKLQLQKMQALFRIYESYFGPYPFANEKYGHCMAPIGGGMEHQTMTTLASLGFELVAHEFAHQWFGNYVTCATWRDIWINEAFATYSEYLALEALGLNERALAWLNEVHQSGQEAKGTIYLTEDESKDESIIFDYLLTYQKGAAIIHMLRHELTTDSTFKDLLKGFLQANAYSVAGIDNFRQYLNAITATNYDWFFDQWIYSDGYPLIDITWEQKNEFLKIKIAQQPAGEALTIFNLKIELKIRYADRDTLVSFRLDSPEKNFTIPINGRVRQVIFDPNHWLLARLNSIHKLEDAHVGKFLVYPNPTNDELNIEATEENIIFTAFLFDSAGKFIWQSQTSQGNLTKSMVQVPKGAYFLRIDAMNQLYGQRVVKY